MRPPTGLTPTDRPRPAGTIGERLRQVTERFADHEALVIRHQGYRASYRELLGEVELAARALIANGVRKGDRVGIWAPNRYEWVVVQYATARVGAILVTINPAYKAVGLQDTLRKAGVRLLFSARGFRGADYVAMLDQVRETCPALDDIVILDDEWQYFLAESDRVSERDLTIRDSWLDPGDAINMRFTSGAIGFPEGATLSHRDSLGNGYFTGETLGYNDRDRVCVPVPFHHCSGMMLANLAAMTHGACVVVSGESFDAGEVLRTAEAERCTSLYGAPAMFVAVLAEPGLDSFDLASLRTGIMDGAPCPDELMQQVRSRLRIEAITIEFGITDPAPPDELIA